MPVQPMESGWAKLPYIGNSIYFGPTAWLKMNFLPLLQPWDNYSLTRFLEHFGKWVAGWGGR